MAIFQVNKKTKSKSGKNVKKITAIVMFALASIVFVFAVGPVPAIQHFLLGTFGLFIFPLCVLAMLISIALLNNKRYVMSKRYAIFLVLSIIFLLGIIQLAIVGAPAKGMGYFQYLVLSYDKLTVGGILLGLLTTTLAMTIGMVASYIVLSLLFVVSTAFFVEQLVSALKSGKQNAPVKISIKEKKKEKPAAAPKQEKEEVNIVLNGNVNESLAKEKSAREKLGLVGSKMPERRELQIQEQPEPKVPQNMSLKEYLLTPPKVDIDSFMARSHTMTQPSPQNTEEIKATFAQMKSTESMPSKQEFSEEYGESAEPIHRSNLPDVKPEELVEQADDIIRSVAQQEFEQMELEPENIENIDADNSNSFDRNRFSDRDRINFNREDAVSRVQNNLDDFARANRDRLDRGDHPERIFENPDRIAGGDRLGERKRRFVSLDDDKKETFKPYKYTKPPIDLITTQSDDLSIFNEEVPLRRVALENTLEKFGIPAKVQSVVIGPTVTRYEIEMPEGISVKRILNLDADMAYALKSKGEIRIEAPIPGRSVVGIEVPNEKVAKVSIKDVLQSKEFSMSPSPLAFALGKDITGTVRVCNLQKMPHLLVAGTTGSGKSVCLNSIIVSMLYRASPDDVKFIMIDPKQVELSMYEGLPHMVIPKVITDATKAVNALSWAVDEMEKRFNLISEARVRNIDEYNQTSEVQSGAKKKIPYLVIIFDEFADFMLVAKNEIEDKIRRLAQKARAAGIHLILATQRPSTDVVTGTIKANFPARIAFKVAGRVDSEVILGSTGAEKLLGYGDMLYKPTDSLSRIQGCFIDTPETKEIVNFIIQNNEEVYDEEANNAINNISKPGNGGDGGDNGGMDPLLPQALKICIDNGVASTTMVQRKLSIGYPRAARIIDQMEERGYISSAEGSKQRSVYTTIEEYYEIFGDNYD